MPKKKSASSKKGPPPRKEVVSEKPGTKLRETLHQTAQILSAATNGIVAVNTDGVITLANPAAADLLNRDVMSMTGISIDRAFVYGSGHPQAGYPLPLKLQFKSGPYYEDQEVHMARSDGESFEAMYSVAPFKENGNISGYVITFRDITVRRRAESELRLAAVVFEHSPEGLVIADAKRRVTKITRPSSVWQRLKPRTLSDKNWQTFLWGAPTGPEMF